MAWGPILAGIAATLGGSYIAAKSSRDANSANINFQDKTNKENREFNIEMYNRERQNILDDRDFANHYNHPVQVMQRLKEAGLNPHMVYGGNTVQQPSALTRSTPTPSGNSIAPKIDNRGMENAILQAANAPQIAMNMASQQQSLELQQKMIELKDAEIAKTISETDTKEFTLQQKQRTADIVYEILNNERRMSGYDANMKASDNVYYAKDRFHKSEILEFQYDMQEKYGETEYGKEIQRLTNQVKLLAQQGELNQFEIDILRKWKTFSPSAQQAISILKLFVDKK